MNLALFIVFGIMIASLLITAIQLFRGKGAFLIAGYNTLSDADKARYDERALCRFTGWIVVAVAISLVLILIGISFDSVWLSIAGIVLLMGTTLYAIIYTNTGNHFIKEDYRQETTPNTGGFGNANKRTSRIVVVSALIISIATILGTGVMMFQGMEEPVVSVSDGSLHIDSMYGLSVDLADITAVSLLESTLHDLAREDAIKTNGFALGQTYKGNFKSESLGEVLLFVQADSSPTLLIERTSGKDIYLSFSDSATTEQIYQSLLEHLGSS